jgi:hypothetical protein
MIVSPIIVENKIKTVCLAVNSSFAMCNGSAQNFPDLEEYSLIKFSVHVSSGKNVQQSVYFLPEVCDDCPIIAFVVIYLIFPLWKSSIDQYISSLLEQHTHHSLFVAACRYPGHSSADASRVYKLRVNINRSEKGTIPVFQGFTSGNKETVSPRLDFHGINMVQGV